MAEVLKDPYLQAKKLPCKKRLRYPESPAPQPGFEVRLWSQILTTCDSAWTMRWNPAWKAFWHEGSSPQMSIIISPSFDRTEYSLFGSLCSLAPEYSRSPPTPLAYPRLLHFGRFLKYESYFEIFSHSWYLSPDFHLHPSVTITIMDINLKQTSPAHLCFGAQKLLKPSSHMSSAPFWALIFSHSTYHLEAYHVIL